MQPTNTGTAVAKANGSVDGPPSTVSASDNLVETFAGTDPGGGYTDDAGFDLRDLLHALQAMRVGDFSVRLPGDRTGLAGKIADTFNEIVAANQTHGRAARAGRPGRRPGGQDAPARALRPADGAWGEMETSVNTLIDDLLWPTTAVTRAITAVAQGDLLQTDAARRRRPAAARRVPALRHHRQHDDQAARRLHLRGDARRARGRHRRQARRPGAGARGDRRLEGPDRERQLDGHQPDRPGPQHRRGDDRRRERRPVQEDHRRRARRDPAAQGSHQHDGRPAALLRLRGDARGARGRAPKASSAARRSCPASPAPGRT